MAITTWITDVDADKYKSVSDFDLNILFQEIREISSRYYLQEKQILIKRFLRKPIVKVVYTLYVHVQSLEYQVMNFAQDSKWSLNTCVSASYIYTFFYGLLNGICIQNNK